MGTSEPTYFRVARRYPGNKIVGSYTWRLHAGSTSFYLKPRESLQDYKISIHGPDPRHSDAGEMIKFSFDSSFGLSKKAQPSFTKGYGVGENGKIIVRGREIQPGVKHVLRMRWTGDMFQDGAYDSQDKKSINKRHTALLIPAPGPFHYIDLDFYLTSPGIPAFIPIKRMKTKDNAVIGPIKNEAHQSLTAVAHHRSALKHPPYEDPMKNQQKLRGLRERVRGMHALNTEEGFLVVQEIWMDWHMLNSSELNL